MLYTCTSCSQGLVCIPQSNGLIINPQISSDSHFEMNPSAICHPSTIWESTGRCESYDPRWMASMRKICSCRSGAANWSWRMWRPLGHWVTGSLGHWGCLGGETGMEMINLGEMGDQIWWFIGNPIWPCTYLRDGWGIIGQWGITCRRDFTTNDSG